MDKRNRDKIIENLAAAVAARDTAKEGGVFGLVGAAVQEALTEAHAVTIADAVAEKAKLRDAARNDLVLALMHAPEIGRARSVASELIASAPADIKVTSNTTGLTRHILKAVQRGNDWDAARAVAADKMATRTQDAHVEAGMATAVATLRKLMGRHSKAKDLAAADADAAKLLKTIEALVAE